MKKIVGILFVLSSFIIATSVFADVECPQPRQTAKAPDDIYNTKNPLPKSPENIAAGKELFHKTAKPVFCEQCHGTTGQGDGKVGKAFKSPKAPRNFACKETMKDVTPGQMFWIIKNGSAGTGMVSHAKTLTDDQIWQLIHYIKSEFLKE